MKNITNIEKTTTAKITAKITTTALLFFLALFTLTTNLKAQAVQDNSKSGFFAGFVYLQGFQVDSTKSVSTSPTTSYRVTGYSPETTRIDATDGPDRSDIVGIRALFSANCETGETSIDINEEYYFVAENFSSFSSGEKPTEEQITNGDATVTALDPEGIPFLTGVREGETSHCFQYFYGDLAAERTLFTEYEVTADSGTPQVSAESDKLSGIGLQFGYRGEKWRASFTHYTGTGGDHELTNSLVIADYFFQEKFFVGAGLASIKLTNSSSGSSISASATSPVLQVGYTENLTKNLQLSIGVLQYSSGLSLSHSSTPATAIADSFNKTQTVMGDSATIGLSSLKTPNGSIGLMYDLFGAPDHRIEVTQVGTRTVNIEEIVTPAGGGTVEAELKAPTVISISFHLSF